MLAESPNLSKRFPFFVHRCGRNFVRLAEAVVWFLEKQSQEDADTEPNGG